MANASQVCVIGAGLSGLAAVKTCLEYGISVICYEDRPQIGGLFTGCDPAFSVVKADGGVFSVVHDQLLMNTSKHISTFSDFPLPKDMDDAIGERRAMTGLEFLEYLNRYAAAFALTDHIQLSTEVIEVRRNKGQDFRSLGWEVTVRQKGSSEVTKTTRHRHVIIASGLFRKPRMQTFPGMEKTPVKVLHTLHCHDTKTLFSGRRVLVLGGSVSSGDIAEVAIKSGAEKVTWALHRKKANDLSFYFFYRCPYYRRFMYDEWFTLFNNLYYPGWMMQRLLSGMINHCAYKRPGAPDPFEEDDRLSVQDYDTLKAAERVGKFRMLQETISSFSEDKAQATLTNGETIDVDIAVLGFGPEPSYSYLDPKVLGDDELSSMPLYRNIVATSVSSWGLYFLYTSTLGGAAVLCSEMESRWTIHNIAANRLSIEADRQRLLEDQKSISRPFEIVKRRMPFPVVYPLMVDLDCKPKLWPALFSLWPRNRRVALAVALGPMTPHQFRLRGPHACPEKAADTVLSVTREALGWKFDAIAILIDAMQLSLMLPVAYFVYRRCKS